MSAMGQLREAWERHEQEPELGDDTGDTASAVLGLIPSVLAEALAEHPHTAALRALVEAHGEWDDLDGQLYGGTNDRALLDAVDAAYNRMDAAYEQARALLGGAR